MLIGSGEEKYLITSQSVPSGQCIGVQGAIGMSDVRSVVDIIDGCGYCKTFYILVGYGHD